MGPEGELPWQRDVILRIFTEWVFVLCLYKPPKFKVFPISHQYGFLKSNFTFIKFFLGVWLEAKKQYWNKLLCKL